MRHVPPSWTDWLPENPALILAGKRCPAFLPDLMRLAELVAALKFPALHSETSEKAPEQRNGNSATTVKQNVQHKTARTLSKRASKRAHSEGLRRIDDAAVAGSCIHLVAQSILPYLPYPTIEAPWNTMATPRLRSCERTELSIPTRSGSGSQCSLPIPSSILEICSRSATRWPGEWWSNTTASLALPRISACPAPPFTMSRNASGREASPPSSTFALDPRALARSGEMFSSSSPSCSPLREDYPTVSCPGEWRHALVFLSIHPLSSVHSGRGGKNIDQLDPGGRSPALRGNGDKIRVPSHSHPWGGVLRWNGGTSHTEESGNGFLAEVHWFPACPIADIRLGANARRFPPPTQTDGRSARDHALADRQHRRAP